MLGLPGQGVCPLPGTLCYLRGGRRHVQPAHCGGQADLDPAAGWGKPGCRWPRKEAVPFLESLGIPKPRSKAEWSCIFKEMGTFLAAKNFIVNCPLPVMELPVVPVHDSKEALRFRAVCDERITLPLSSFRAFDSVYTKLVAGLSKSSMVEIKVNWRCNVVHDWVEPVLQEAAGYDRLGYSPHHAPHAGPGHQKVPPDHRGHCHGGRGQEVHQQALPDGHQARVLGPSTGPPGPPGDPLAGPSWQPPGLPEGGASP